MWGTIIGGVVAVFTTIFSSSSTKKAQKKAAADNLAEASNYFGLGDQPVEFLRDEKSRLLDQQRTFLMAALSALKQTTVGGWRDEIRDMETKLSNSDFATEIDNRPHKGARVFLSGKNRGLMDECNMYIEKFNDNAGRLRAILVTLDNAKDSGSTTGLTGLSIGNQPTENQDNKNKQLIAVVAVVVIVFLIYKRRRK